TTETGNNNPKKFVTGTNGAPDSSENSPSTGIVAGQLTPGLEKVIQDGKLTYKFTIKNDMKHEDLLKYSSTQQFDYQLTDSNGTVIYTYSMDKLFAQTQSEQSLRPGEVFTIEIDLSDDLKQLKPGTYQLEVWSSAENRDELRAKTEVNWGGEGEDIEDVGKLGGATVTYVGLIDNNSIEVITEDGKYDHFRLSEKVKPEFDSLAKGTKITIHYGISDAQKIIEAVLIE
ncbi:MAG TPA: BsuPI-related putative proteinase inhibitor, partial [Pseudoneobacillus sp.]|nr:BsuPI-related putative proteinase inhibitor [Pseudoneobacillus sp.]